jgi:hypothetical protein
VAGSDCTGPVRSSPAALSFGRRAGDSEVTTILFDIAATTRLV